MPTSFGVSGQNPPILCSVEFIFFIFQWFVFSLRNDKQKIRDWSILVKESQGRLNYYASTQETWSTAGIQELRQNLLLFETNLMIFSFFLLEHP